ncbi:YbaB/EbfC family nucleoid-associated protein [Actinoplanes sp. TFC3]|uniref:YbaB/EbfC family nucleoid-associated protein n=1 Tax=Actinoplanes sp. TFC3 TaxID=1710355 RepID=UPI000836D332|nr:YbaB/EbfC family nucleoid-associated protein [Actinoplanes sp. TFC3]
MQPDMQQFLNEAKAFEQQMRDAQTDLGKAIVTGRSADGSVTVVASGMGKLQGVRVDPSVFDRRDVQALQLAIAEAVQSAAANAGKLAEQKMGPIEITLH